MRSFVLTAPATEAELAGDVLFAAGVAAVEERASDTPGSIELWTHVGDEQEAIEQVATTLAPSWTWRVVEVDETVAETWRRHAVPIAVTGSLTIVPAWLDDVAVSGATVVIDPGSAFGLGDHPTTQLTLRSLLRHLDAATSAPARALDVGCGSGVLAIAAAQRGVEHVVAIDIHPAAVEATRANAVRNRVDDRITASATPLADVDGSFDVVLANVLAPVLVELADDLRRVTAPGGLLVISGVLDGKFDHVVDALAPMRVRHVDVLDGWAAVELV